uniref:B-cell receptor CD22 first Ig-like domain-containing protein n=1 Tax=Oryzias melastigma TaxID=30732 RepID=A0A3B3CNF0_ORYME
VGSGGPWRRDLQPGVEGKGTCSSAGSALFSHLKTQITAEEDSCVEIKCKPTGVPADTGGAEWFWMKNPTWTGSKGFTGTVLYSTDESKRPISPLFKNRVTYTGSIHGSAGTQQGHQLCQIQICNLSLSDSGIYLFRYEKGTNKWMTDPRIQKFDHFWLLSNQKVGQLYASINCCYMWFLFILYHRLHGLWATTYRINSCETFSYWPDFDLHIGCRF